MMRPSRRGFLTVLMLLGLTGCAGAAVHQLSDMKKKEKTGDTTALAQAKLPADCASSTGNRDVCAQINEIKARACLVEARKETASAAACPPPSQRESLKCAVSGFAAARNGGFKPDDTGAYAENEARANYCLATMSKPPDSTELANSAMSLLATAPVTANRALIAASSALRIARSNELAAGQRCENARRAITLAQSGLSQSPQGDLTGALNSVVNNAADVAKSLPSCGGT